MPEFKPGDLIVNDYPVQTVPVTIVSGAGVLTRGAVLGKITASGKHNLSASAAGDGSQTPDLVLAVNVDATSADVAAVAYASAGFDSGKLIFGTGTTIASTEAAFRAKAAPLYIKTPA